MDPGLVIQPLSDAVKAVITLGVCQGHRIITMRIEALECADGVMPSRGAKRGAAELDEEIE